MKGPSKSLLFTSLEVDVDDADFQWLLTLKTHLPKNKRAWHAAKEAAGEDPITYGDYKRDGLIPRCLLMWFAAEHPEKVTMASRTTDGAMDATNAYKISGFPKLMLLLNPEFFPIGRRLLHESPDGLGEAFDRDVKRWSTYNVDGAPQDQEDQVRWIGIQCKALALQWWKLVKKYWNRLKIDADCSIYRLYVQQHNVVVTWVQRHNKAEVASDLGPGYTSALFRELVTSWARLSNEKRPQISCAVLDQA